MNKWIWSWFIGQDIVIKQTPTGVSIANTSLATSEKVKKWDNWEEETTWHNLVAFWYTANFMDKYLIKWSKILVEWKISNRSWDKPDWTKWYKSEIIVNSVEFAWWKKKDENQEEIKQKSINDNYDEISLEDIPF
jgi:single-strand DNA-binding protein